MVKVMKMSVSRITRTDANLSEQEFSELIDVGIRATNYSLLAPRSSLPSVMLLPTSSSALHLCTFQAFHFQAWLGDSTLSGSFCLPPDF